MDRKLHSRRTATHVALVSLAALAAAAAPSARALTIIPSFDSSITDPSTDPSVNASGATTAEIEGAVNSAISTLEGLYSNNATINVNFTFAPAQSANNLLSTGQYYTTLSFAQYQTALQDDLAANPGNSVLATALAHLSDGNGANSPTISVSDAQYNMLALYDGALTPIALSTAQDPVININSLQPDWAFSQPTTSGDYDVIGGLEHELDEVLGGGGAGSTLNFGGCVFSITGETCPGAYGPLDLYRYSGSGVGSYTGDGSASSYFSIDGGATDIVGFNQNSGGDYADFGGQGGAFECQTGNGGQLIQNAFNCAVQDEDYNLTSPEFTMEESIGWDPFTQSGTPSTPEPASLSLFGAALAGVAAIRRRRRG